MNCARWLYLGTAVLGLTAKETCRMSPRTLCLLLDARKYFNGEKTEADKLEELTFKDVCPF